MFIETSPNTVIEAKIRVYEMLGAEVFLYFDYEGIEKWCVGVWKANKEGTIEYKKFYDSIKDKLHVEFIKVKAHSGDRYNEEADKLAKAAIGI